MAENLTEEQAQKIANTSTWQLLKNGAKGLAQEYAKKQETKYPWSEWTDGQWWSIEKDEDYDQSARSMQSMLYTHARRHSMTVQVIKRMDILIFKFTDNG